MADDDDTRGILKIEAEFAVPVVVTQDQWRKIAYVLDEILKNPGSCPEGCVHWVSGYGMKPIWSATDRKFLGLPPDPNAPPDGEPGWDSTVVHFSTYCRTAHPGEKQ